MIDNWKISAYLRSPLAGDPPKMDAILEYELALRLGMKHARKLTRDVRLADVERVPIPLARRTIDSIDVYCCSDPILSPVLSEWTDHSAKRFDSDLIVLMLREDQRKNLLTSSGPYKSRFAPIRVRLVECVTWFARGDRKEINKLVKKIVALGKHRSIGYGLIDRWEYERMDEDYSIFASLKGQRVLMKTLHVGDHLEGVKGYTKYFGAAFPPYWHPENYREIAVPC